MKEFHNMVTTNDGINIEADRVEVVVLSLLKEFTSDGVIDLHESIRHPLQAGRVQSFKSLEQLSKVSFCRPE